MVILTMELNEYDQCGEYFVAAFDEQPTIEQLREVLPHVENKEIKHIQQGGGRRHYSYEWYHLRYLKSGEALYNRGRM